VKLVREGWAPLLVVSRSETNAPTSSSRHARTSSTCASSASPRIHTRPSASRSCSRGSPPRGTGPPSTSSPRSTTSSARRILLKRCYHGTLRVVGAPNGWVAVAENAVLESLKLAYHELVHRGC
jgi:hypothetical protein